MPFDLEQIYDEAELEQIYHSFKIPKKVCVFLNTLKTTAKELENEFLTLNLEFEKINDFCYIFAANYKAKLTQMKAFNEALFYIQNYSSYLCAKNLGVFAGAKVLDMCAAPGGKSINLANFMQNRGELACVEASKDRFFILQKNLKNYGVKIARCFLKDAKSIGRLCPLKFDRILLDAPCSTLAKEGFKLQRSAKEFKELAKTQKKLLHSALKALKCGGELVYSTCTFLKEENEEVIENALRSEFQLELLELDLEGVSAKDGFSKNYEELKKSKRILPNEINDGFFIAKFRKI